MDNNKREEDREEPGATSNTMTEQERMEADEKLKREAEKNEMGDDRDW